jgi:hypothetical protein
MIQACEKSLADARANLEDDAELHDNLNGPEAKNEEWAGGYHGIVVDESIRLAGLKHAAGFPVEQVQSHFLEAGRAFLRIARMADHRIKVTEPFLDPARRATKNYGSRPGVVKVETFVDEAKGKKEARVHLMRQPAGLIFTRSLEAALISGDVNLAKKIAETYQYTGLNDGAILRFFVLGDDEQVSKNEEIFKTWVAGNKDGDWPYPRRQFPQGILTKDEGLLADGVLMASKAFRSRWKSSRYTTPAMLRRLKTPENAMAEAKKFLVNMKWVLYTHGLAFSIVAARRGMRDFLSDEQAWSEWVPKELVLGAI